MLIQNVKMRCAFSSNYTQPEKKEESRRLSSSVRHSDKFDEAQDDNDQRISRKKTQI